VPRFRDASAVERDSLALANLVEWTDIVVVVTAHGAVDWDLLYHDAALVVDTVNTSRGRNLRAGQLLRLGTGWSQPG
jgi:UDP-N-acetyl-D-mannosaminuronate dehydrogenase